ncbi:winged helix-turn-helix domain-containing protein [Salipiger sp. 1_MG-2023]|uniref:winged helix-turn-helix domain-containing protein n=1 Tax=Salipiger sp. 1_MG-2023 TaxID=3062665 RepID=UPI0026E40EC3|nr:winged helix-turn-helix domain-containing protein [Salipiger sp. 1_MG-2023]MDO6587357.1 winged helix-turn-helix domain-containing protein [Salipiger sp. 1_MG-2023]
MKAVVSENDLLGAKTDGMTRMDLARDIGCSRTAVIRAEARHGLYLRKGPSVKSSYDDIEQMAHEMAARDAVEWLLEIINSVMSPDDMRCRWPGIHMTVKQRDLLLYLYGYEGKTRTKPQIMDAIYSATEDAPGAKIIDVYICKLRRLIKGTGARIETEWGVGYSFHRDAGVVFSWEREA